MNLTIDPWIPAVWADGRRELFSLLDLFARAHELRDLAVKPHERVALMRLLLCIAHGALDGPADETEWRNCKSFIQPRVRIYIEKWRAAFEMFGEGERFLQLPNLKPNKAADKGNSATKLDLTLATGNNSTLFDNQAGEERPIRAARAAVNLLTFQNFAPCGRIGVALWNGKETAGAGSSNHAPCTSSSMIHTFLLGPFLLETLHLNLLNRNVINNAPNAGWGKPIWEFPVTEAAGESLHNARMTYLGRLVPLSRAIRLNENGIFIILANGLDYPVFPAFREGSATIIQRNHELGLLSASSSRSFWRQLAAITVKLRTKADAAAGPLVLHNLIEGSDAVIWVGALIAAGNGKIVDVVESAFSLPSGMFSDFGCAAYEKGVAYAEKRENVVIKAIREYSSELQITFPAYARARQHFWTRIEQRLSDLFDLARNPNLAADIAHSPWGKAVQTAAINAFEQSCLRQTPRQIEAYTFGLRNLTFSSGESSKYTLPMSKPKNTPKERASEFVAALRRARNDRGKFAALRRGLTDNPRMHVDAWPVVADLGGDIGQPVFVAIAALFASHPEESTARNIGETCRLIARSDEIGIAKSFERRFRRLLSCSDVADVINQLRSWVRLAASKRVGINYENLMFDLMLWNKYADDVRLRWARAFWQSDETSPSNT